MELTPELLDEVFARTPIVDVIFEVKFNPILRITSDVSLFQDKIRHELPQYGEERLGLDKGLAFYSDEGRKIRVNQETFNVSVKSYTKFSDFKNFCLGSFALFQDLFGIDIISRVGLRYINQLSLNISDTREIVRDYVDIPIDTHRLDDADLDGFKLELFIKKDNIHISGRHALLGFDNGMGGANQHLYMLDIDCFCNEKIALDELGTILDRLHSAEKEEFLRSIKPKYLEWMREA